MRTETPNRSPLTKLTGIFIAWKALLLFIAWSAPGDGYDTSTNLLLPRGNKLVRWDALYFTQMAHRGHRFEQEWAFGKGISTLFSILSVGSLESIISTGILIAHLSHYVSVLCLWYIADMITSHEGGIAQRNTLPFTACCLHIVAPAGIFLSAPYTESPFSALNMLGFCLYLKSSSMEGKSSLRISVCLLIAAGLSFGLASFIRSNGILSGIPLFLDALRYCYELMSAQTRDRGSWRVLALLISTILAGLFIAAGFVIPQYVAYHEYCLGGIRRPWCSNIPPSVFSFVQSHYWNVGFLRYWTLSNVPLFLLALPTLMLLLYSSATSIALSSYLSKDTSKGKMLVSQIALPQMVLAGLAITNYHVQIVTRLSSGYPWLYIWLAKQIYSEWRFARISVQFFVMYALIQASLFASFLPPA